MEEVVARYRETLLRELRAADSLRLFTRPTDAWRLGIPHYGSVVKRPIDLRTVERRVTLGLYGSGAEAEGAEALCWDDDAAFFGDVARVYANAVRFFGPLTRAHRLARRLLARVAVRREGARRVLAAARALLPQPEPEPAVAEEEAPAPESAPAKAPTSKRRIPYSVLRRMGAALPGLPPDAMLAVVKCVRPGVKAGEEAEVEFALDELPHATQAAIKRVLDRRKVGY